MENLKIVSAYFLGTGGLVLVLMVNYFHSDVEALLPYLPPLFIFKMTIIIYIIAGYILYRHEKRVDHIKYEFLTLATHKFRTPITAIRWLTDSLKKEISYEERMNVIKQIGISVDRIMEVVDTLAGLVKSDGSLRYALEVAWLREMVEVALSKYSPQAEKKGIIFNVTSDQNIPLVIIDKKKIQSVVDILFENSIQYSPKGGTIDVFLRKEGNFVCLSVKDQGIGIKKHDMANLFKRFYRTNEAKLADPEGMGLSLSMMKEIVTKHKGKILVESPGVNQGSTFTVKLKASKERPV